MFIFVQIFVRDFLYLIKILSFSLVDLDSAVPFLCFPSSFDALTCPYFALNCLSSTDCETKRVANEKIRRRSAANQCTKRRDKYSEKHVPFFVCTNKIGRYDKRKDFSSSRDARNCGKSEHCILTRAEGRSFFAEVSVVTATNSKHHHHNIVRKYRSCFS